MMYSIDDVSNYTQYNSNLFFITCSEWRNRYERCLSTHQSTISQQVGEAMHSTLDQHRMFVLPVVARGKYPKVFRAMEQVLAVMLSVMCV